MSLYSDMFVATPLWAQSADPAAKRKDRAKRIWKHVLKWTKLLVFLFLLVMGLWGCFQTMFESQTKTNTSIGLGMEFGFSFGTTGDYRYDLSRSGSGQYYTFALQHWGMQYGPFYGWFVFPGAALVLEIMYPIRNWWGGLNALLGIFILLLIIRTITFLISIRSTMQSERMSEIQGKLAEINAKYKDVKKDMAMRQRKQMETQELYKKYNIKPFAMFEQMFITLPIFLIVYRVVTILRPIKVISLFTIWNLGYTPLTEILSDFVSGGWVYLFFLAFVIPAQVMSQKLPQILARRRSKNAQALSSQGNKQAKRMRTIQTVMIVVLVFVIVSSPTGIGTYWFLSSLFTILQSVIIHKIIMKRRSRGTSLEDKLKSLGIE